MFARSKCSMLFIKQIHVETWAIYIKQNIALFFDISQYTFGTLLELYLQHVKMFTRNLPTLFGFLLKPVFQVLAKHRNSIKHKEQEKCKKPEVINVQLAIKIH